MKKANAQNSRRNKSPVLTEFLKGLLAQGAVGVPELEDMARAAGHLGKRQSITRSKPFQAAKKSLGIRSIRTGFAASAWRWTLPKPRAAISSPGPKSVESTVLSKWVKGVAQLAHRPRPGDVPLHRWDRFLADCHAFLNSEWAPRAARLGWDSLRLFGCRPHGTLVHPGAAGLVWALTGGLLVELHREWAIIEMSGSGSRRVFGRSGLKAAKLVLPWEEGSHPVA
jgi:hypothetical protein